MHTDQIERKVTNLTNPYYKHNNRKTITRSQEYFHCTDVNTGPIDSESAHSRSPESSEISNKGLPGAVLWEWWRAMKGEEGGRQVVHIKGNKLSAAIKFMADEPVRRAIWRHLPLHTFSLRLVDGARVMECF